jgi:hypothetical protein
MTLKGFIQSEERLNILFIQILLSFILPVDPVAGEDYFRDPMEKIALWGNTSQDPDILAAIPAAQQAQKESKANVEEDDEKEKTVIHQPVTIKLEGADEKIWNAIAKTLKPLDVVQQSMMEKVYQNQNHSSCSFVVSKRYYLGTILHPHTHLLLDANDARAAFLAVSFII